MAATAAEQETWLGFSFSPSQSAPSTDFLHMEAKQSHRTALGIGISTDISISGYKNILVVLSLSFYKNPFINP